MKYLCCFFKNRLEKCKKVHPEYTTVSNNGFALPCMLFLLKLLTLCNKSILFFNNLYQVFFDSENTTKNAGYCLYDKRSDPDWF